jgi:hypothetical protein
MADDRSDRISRLSKRFTTHAVGRQKTSERNRERKSFYLDGDLVTRMDQTYREINHALYPKRVSKSTFLETVLERGLENRDELQALLAELSDSEDIPEE